MKSIQQHSELPTKEQIWYTPPSFQGIERVRHQRRVLPLAQDARRFDLGRKQYLRIRLLGGLFFGVFIAFACIAMAIGHLLWKSYPHTFTPYLKWQDALFSLCCFATLMGLGCGILVLRFLFAVHLGTKQGMIDLKDKSSITVRDLSPENLYNLFWAGIGHMLVFVIVLIGLLPFMALQWTLGLPNIPLSILTTGIAILTGLGGLILSSINALIIIIGLTGLTSFWNLLGAPHTYRLDKQITIRLDNLTLTVTYPAAPESIIDLNLLTHEDQRQLLLILHKRRNNAESIWSTSLV